MTPAERDAVARVSAWIRAHGLTAFVAECGCPCHRFHMVACRCECDA